MKSDMGVMCSTRSGGPLCTMPMGKGSCKDANMHGKTDEMFVQRDKEEIVQRVAPGASLRG